MRHRIMVAALAAIIIVSTASCGRKENGASEPGQVLVQVGDSVLTLQDVERRIPHGLDPADSAMLFRNIVDRWVAELVLQDVAQNNVTDMAKIDRMVEAYRNSMIVNEYLSSMTQTDNKSVSDARIRDYYDTHREEFRLTQPLVKGALVRVDRNDSQLDNLRRWMTQATDDSFDKIERDGLKHATAYEYFRDTWHEWSDIADRIPYRFFDADAFLRSTKNLETEAEGSVYLLHISEYLPTGEEMPYEFARNKILEILRAEDINAERNRLKSDIYRRKAEEGFLRPGLYDPMTGEMKPTTLSANKTNTK